MTHRDRVAIVGVGYSTVGRRTGLSERELTAQAVKAALHDSGFEAADIDGISSMATSADEAIDDAMAHGWMLGFDPVSWFATSSAYSPAFSHPAVQAYAAVKAGLCNTAIVIRSMLQKRSGSMFTRPPEAAESMLDFQFQAPFGAGSGPNWAGMMMRRHMFEFGTTPEQFASHAVAKREFASLNEDALLRDPLTIDEYLSSRFISEPVRLLDCDYPCDVASAVIFTTEDRARDCKKQPVFVESASVVAVQDMNFELLGNMVDNAPTKCASDLWSRTSLTPGDIDCAQVYDGFSIIAFEWIEALGFCGIGEAGSFIADGHTSLRGSLPLNTDGGACNVGRRHGANFCIEATRQLRGECGERQVPGAEVSVFTNAVAGFAGGMILTGS